MAKINYTTVGSNRLEDAKAYYDALLPTAGFSPMFEHPSGGRAYGGPDGQIFAVLGPHDMKAATVGNGSMIAFAFDTRDEIDAFHAKGIALGGSDDGAPGERNPGAYFAYFRDLDGNKLCGYKLG
jgi:catechol 2,3-dioxygenase-like lactoylglutathione lyase family enzyme